jgi:hypothetical protein
MKPVPSSFVVLVACLCSAAGAAFGQTSFNASSANATLKGGIAHEYVVGEMMLVHTASAGTVKLTQGFLQPHRLYVESVAQGGYTDLLENLKVFPNPTTDLLFVECLVNETSRLTYQLFDATGHLILNKNAMQREGADRFSIDLRSFASGTYFLVITKDGGERGPSTYSYKISKIN